MNCFRVISLVFTFFLISCSCIDYRNEIVSSSILIDEDLFKGGLFHIEIPENHPSSFAIKSPSETWFVLQDSEEGIQMLSQSDFDEVREIEFHIQDMKGVTWRNSIKYTEVIFNESGLYLIYFANNLETEPENTNSLQASVCFSK